MKVWKAESRLERSYRGYISCFSFERQYGDFKSTEDRYICERSYSMEYLYKNPLISSNKGCIYLVECGYESELTTEQQRDIEVSFRQLIAKQLRTDIKEFITDRTKQLNAVELYDSSTITIGTELIDTSKL